MEMSRKVVSKNWFLIFLFVFVGGIIASVGMLALIIGILATYSIAPLMTYAAFADVTDLLSKDDSDIVDHLVD